MAGRSFHPDELAAAYDFLLATPPFKRWKLPPSDEIAFSVVNRPDIYGECVVSTDPPTIRISSAVISHTNKMIEVLAHEVTHLYQALNKRETPGVQHNADFRALSLRICRAHGWDPKGF